MKLVKISELPSYETLDGLLTIGTDSDNKSVQVPLSVLQAVLRFDRIEEGSSIDVRVATPSSYDGVAWIAEKSMFAAYIVESGTRYIYYSSWNADDEHGASTDYIKNKIYICQSTLYLWDGSTLIELGGSGGDTTLEELREKYPYSGLIDYWYYWFDTEPVNGPVHFDGAEIMDYMKNAGGEIISLRVRFQVTLMRGNQVYLVYNDVATMIPISEALYIGFFDLVVPYINEQFWELKEKYSLVNSVDTETFNIRVSE